jgi:hypothetical protein
MEVSRKPFQVILIEQLFYPFLFTLGLFLLVQYGMIAAAKNINIEAEYIVYGFLGLFILCLYGMLYIWLPYTCIRLWNSASIHSQGPLLYMYKIYAGVVFVVLVVSALVSFVYLPEVINEIQSHNNML